MFLCLSMNFIIRAYNRLNLDEKVALFTIIFMFLDYSLHAHCFNEVCYAMNRESKHKANVIDKIVSNNIAYNNKHAKINPNNILYKVLNDSELEQFKSFNKPSDYIPSKDVMQTISVINSISEFNAINSENILSTSNYQNSLPNNFYYTNNENVSSETDKSNKIFPKNFNVSTYKKV